MENKEVVSIVIPIYNVEAYLRKCLETIVNQTYPHLEIILVNDGSPDHSEAISKEFFKKDSRIRYDRQLMVAYLQLEIRGLTWLQATILLL